MVSYLRVCEILLISIICYQNGDTPLHVAVFFNARDVAAYLIGMGANVDAVGTETSEQLLSSAQYPFAQPM